MAENIIILLIVLVCAVYVGRKFYRQFKGTESGCGCECSGCDSRMTAPQGEERAGGEGAAVPEIPAIAVVKVEPDQSPDQAAQGLVP